MASSFDQVGVCAKTIDDTQAVFDVIKGIDPLDATTQDYIFHKKITSLQGLRIGLPKQYFDEGLDPQVKETILATVDKLVEQ
jgi:aspartyl-tRNA(Asn)/glutamyl-tRNA(Gln) amidotransferase subunit A